MELYLILKIIFIIGVLVALYAIFRNLDKIYAIMDDYGIPHTEPIFVDRLDGYKRHKK